LRLLLVVAIGGSHLRHLLKELLPLLARRHTRADGEVLPPDLHLGRGVGTQVQIPPRVRIGPALGPYDDIGITRRGIKQGRRALLAGVPPDRGEQQAGHEAGDASDGRIKQMPFGSSTFAIHPQMLSDPCRRLAGLLQVAVRFIDVKFTHDFLLTYRSSVVSLPERGVTPGWVERLANAYG